MKRQRKFRSWIWAAVLVISGVLTLAFLVREKPKTRTTTLRFVDLYTDRPVTNVVVTPCFSRPSRLPAWLWDIFPDMPMTVWKTGTVLFSKSDTITVDSIPEKIVDFEAYHIWLSAKGYNLAEVSYVLEASHFPRVWVAGRRPGSFPAETNLVIVPFVETGR
jgi:hypothetical protein